MQPLFSFFLLKLIHSVVSISAEGKGAQSHIHIQSFSHIIFHPFLRPFFQSSKNCGCLFFQSATMSKIEPLFPAPGDCPSYLRNGLKHPHSCWRQKLRRHPGSFKLSIWFSSKSSQIPLPSKILSRSLSIAATASLAQPTVSSGLWGRRSQSGPGEAVTSVYPTARGLALGWGPSKGCWWSAGLQGRREKMRTLGAPPHLSI